MSELLTRVTIRPDQCGGRPCIRGLRMRVSDVLGMLAAGEAPAAILEHHPDLQPEDISACLAYAAREVDRAAAIPA
ncbi:MAG: DUF433 domain-containing protein [Brevundimonas sp.]|nr:DUF433 domain-containing protein [Brevundimonas sp.]RZJ18284.1 MAG: DUF433 domain-containing protein [Brevundimonas sp.]